MKRALAYVSQGAWPGKSITRDLVKMEEPVAQVAKGLGIREGTLRRWIAQDDVDSERVEGLTSAEKRELSELQRKMRLLEMENKILKRA